MSTAALVAGIISAAALFLFPPLGLPSGMVGLVISVVARKERKEGASTAGLLLSLVGLIGGFISAVLCFALGIGIFMLSKSLSI